MRENQITGQIVDAAVKIHAALGPGLFESVYESALEYELLRRGFSVVRQQPLPVFYETVHMQIGFRVDLIVADRVIVEIKSIDALAPIHSKQLLTYLRLTGKRIGLLLNFGELLMKNGIRRVVDQFDG